MEKDRGVTMRVSTASMLYHHPVAVGMDRVINMSMIYTPGHDNFGY